MNDKTKTCGHCKEDKPLSEFYKEKGRRDGHTYLCKICRSTYYKKYYKENLTTVKTYKDQWYQNNKESYYEWGQTLIGKYTCYKNSAKCTDKTFLLTIEEFSGFWQLPCTYCGSEIKTIGLDRIDNSRGYEIDNITPCCYICNRMRMQLSQGEWFNQMKKILKFMEVEWI